MTRKKTKLNTEDKELFASWVKDVRPLKTHQDKISPAKMAPQKFRKMNSDNFEVNSPEWSDPIFEEQMLSSDDYTEHLGSGIQKQLIKKLKQGKIPVEIRVDLHGYTIDQARSEINQLLTHCQLNTIRCICVVHGKGTYNEDGKAVLKSMVQHWLKQAPEVLALCTALPEDGGTGAVYVLLRKQR